MSNEAGTRRWSVGRAFLLGAAVGALLEFAWGWIDYGRFEIGFFHNHVLGGLFVAGVLFALFAALANWRRRNPLRGRGSRKEDVVRRLGARARTIPAKGNGRAPRPLTFPRDPIQNGRGFSLRGPSVRDGAAPVPRFVARGFALSRDGARRRSGLLSFDPFSRKRLARSGAAGVCAGAKTG